MEQIVISVIIPIYNAERYLSSCLDSVFEQEFSLPFEVIAVNNNSTDKTLKILNEYKAKYDNLVILNESENKGAAVARIDGINISRGEYLAFIDSDNLYRNDFLKTMYEEIRKGYDIVGCNYYFLKGDKVNKSLFSSNKTYNSIQITKALLSDTWMRGFMWNKLFKSSLFKQSKIIYPRKPRILFEDVVTIYHTLMKINSFKAIKEPLYYYRINESSSTSVVNIERFNHHLYCFALIRYLAEHNDNKGYLKAFRSRYFRCWLSLYYDANLLKKQFGHSALTHLHKFKKELKLLKLKKPLPVEGEVWNEYFKDCLD